MNGNLVNAEFYVLIVAQAEVAARNPPVICNKMNLLKSVLIQFVFVASFTDHDAKRTTCD